MNERVRRSSHTAVRAIAAITLLDLGLAAVSPKYSQTTARSWLGPILTFWAIGVSLLLPLYVGLEIWWFRDDKAAIKDLWIDAALASACLVTMIAVAVYAIGHYAMF